MSAIEALAGTHRFAHYAALPVCVPESTEELAAIQSTRKRVAVERARRSRFWRPRLSHIDIDKLDDPEHWAKIPILGKDELRAMTPAAFYEDFCTHHGIAICEYWRSGGSTGRPLFYPKTYEDMLYNMIGFTRTFACAGLGTAPGTNGPGTNGPGSNGPGSNDRVHLSMPLGIHPAGHAWARAAEIMGMGVIWGGSGASLPSAQQLELIDMLAPTVWLGMSSYGLHLANLAEAEGRDLAASSVTTIMCTAEPCSAAKREKLERDWQAEVYDCFGMTEITMLGAEGPSHAGFRVWSDLAHYEVLDPRTWKPVADGEPGRLVVTALFGNQGAPFLRWDSGDIVTMNPSAADDGPYSVFPLLRHAHRTAGFFKVRGVNVNHQEFEDFMFENPAINDFKAELVSEASGLDLMRVSIEVRRGAQAEALRTEIVRRTKAAFEVTPEVVVLETGTLAREFESSIKAPRFVDRRE